MLAVIEDFFKIQDGKMASVAALLKEGGAKLVGVQDALFAEEEPLVLFLFPESTEPSGLPLSKLTVENVRSKRHAK